MDLKLAKKLADQPQWVVGFMSGTSLDGVDAALLLTDGESVQEFGAWRTVPYSAERRAILAEATRHARDWAWIGAHPESFARATQEMTLAHAEACEALLADWDGPAPVLAGFHGQTVLHRRPQDGVFGATLQLADGELLARRLGFPVIYDLRSADVAAGGEGAPLAPIYHGALLQKTAAEVPGVVLNIGGVANFTWRSRSGDLIAFDTGPGNGPIDEWVEMHGVGVYDADGALARAGRVDEAKIAAWLQHPYFAAPFPKSLDRYDFSAEKLVAGMSLEDGAATLTAFAARTILRGLAQMPEQPSQVVATGGGRLNPEIMALLRAELGGRLKDASEFGWRGDAIEAEAFAYLAARAARSLPISFPNTTKAPVPMTGGRLAGRHLI